MKVSYLVFRLRYVLHTVVFLLGFWAPWNRWLHLDPPGPNAHVWGLLAANLARVVGGNIGTAFQLLLAIGILLAFAGAAVRTWGAAYLGADVVHDASLHSGERAGIITGGPFRYVRNPLYLGTMAHALALALLMPRSGAIFTIVATASLQLVLISQEETFLGSRLGESYRAYCRLVPRLWPAFRPRIVASGAAPRWPQAVLSEIYMWVVAVSFAVAGWGYNAALLTQCVIVAFGVSLLARAVFIRPAATA